MAPLLRPTLVSFLLCLLYLVPTHSLDAGPQNASHSHYVSDACDWTGGGPDIGSDGSVGTTYLRCSRGTVRWLYPGIRSGMRVVLKLGTGNKNFKGCIRLHSNSTNVRIYIEGKRQLHQIYAPDDGKHPDLLRCFVSVHSFMALLIETEPNSAQDLHSQHHIAFSYDLQATNSTTPEGNMDECSPCRPERVLALYCAADFVVSGLVTYFHHRPEVQMTEFQVKTTFVYRLPVGSSYVNNFNTSQYIEYEHENSIETEAEHLSRITLNRPLKCAAGATARTEYLFLGRQMLGNLLIECAPRISDWRQISKKALEAGTNQCHII